MYTITVEDTFDAAHCLREYNGSCQRLHGHTYKVAVRFACPSLDEHGMAIDFRRAKSVLKSVLDYLDHQYINDLPEFSIQNPSAENLAEFVFDRVRESIPETDRVSVWETPTSCATYSEEG